MAWQEAQPRATKVFGRELSDSAEPTAFASGVHSRLGGTYGSRGHWPGRAGAKRNTPARYTGLMGVTHLTNKYISFGSPPLINCHPSHHCKNERHPHNDHTHFHKPSVVVQLLYYAPNQVTYLSLCVTTSP